MPGFGRRRSLGCVIWIMLTYDIASSVTHICSMLLFYVHFHERNETHNTLQSTTTNKKGLLIPAYYCTRTVVEVVQAVSHGDLLIITLEHF